MYYRVTWTVTSTPQELTFCLLRIAPENTEVFSTEEAKLLEISPLVANVATSLRKAVKTKIEPNFGLRIPHTRNFTTILAINYLNYTMLGPLLGLEEGYVHWGLGYEVVKEVEVKEIRKKLDCLELSSNSYSPNFIIKNAIN